MRVYSGISKIDFIVHLRLLMQALICSNLLVYLYEQTNLCFLQQATAIENHENLKKPIEIYQNPTSDHIIIESYNQKGISISVKKETR